MLWAEDGGIFLHQALQAGGVGLLTPYEGYVHFIPRLAAALTVAVTEPVAYALSMNVLSCIAVACVAGAVFHCSSALTERVPVKVAFASIIPLIGAGPLETTGNFANLHWYLLLLTPFLLVKRSRTRREASLLLGLGLAISLTEILSAVFLPLVLSRFRDRTLWPARIGISAGCVAQAIATLSSPRTDSPSEALSATSIILGWFVNGGGTIIFGTGPHLGSVVANFGLIPVILASVPFVGAVVFVIWKGEPRHRLMAITLLCASVIIWVAIQVVNPAPFFAYSDFTADDWRWVRPSRYAVIVSMLLLMLVPLVLAVLPRPATAPRAMVSAALITLQLVTLLPPDTARLNGPDWGVGMQEAVRQCSVLDADAYVDVGIAPVGWFADRVSIPCRSL